MAFEIQPLQVLWRFSRTLYELANSSDGSTAAHASASLFSFLSSFFSFISSSPYFFFISSSFSSSSASSSASSSEQLLHQALVFAERAVAAAGCAADAKVPGATADAADAHLWFAIVLEALGQRKKLRDKIADAFVIKGQD